MAPPARAVEPRFPLLADRASATHQLHSKVAPRVRLSALRPRWTIASSARGSVVPVAAQAGAAIPFVRPLRRPHTLPAPEPQIPLGFFRWPALFHSKAPLLLRRTSAPLLRPTAPVPPPPLLSPLPPPPSS